MTKPKDKTASAPTAKTTKPLSQDDVGNSTLLAPPPWLYAKISTGDDDVCPVLLPVAALVYRDDKLTGYVPVAQDLLPVSEVDGFLGYYSGEPDAFAEAWESEADGEIGDDDDEDADDDDDFEEDEEDPDKD